MTSLDKLITPEDYEKIKDYSHQELYAWMESQLGESIIHGYGFYGCSGICKNQHGEPYISYGIGDSCD